MSDIDIRSSLSEEEKKRLARIDILDANKKRKKVIIAVVTGILVSFFVFGTVFGGMHILSFEGTQALPVDKEEYPSLPAEEKEILEAVGKYIDSMKNYPSVKLNADFSVAIPDESIVTEGENSEYIRAYFVHIKDSFVSFISSLYSSRRHEGKYGEDFSSVLPFFGFTSDDAEISYLINEENQNDLRYITSFTQENGNPSEDIVSKVFEISDVGFISEEIKKELGDKAEIGDISVSYSELTQTFFIDRSKDKINKIQQKRICNVSVPIKFINDFSDMGEIDLSFDIEFIKDYIFTEVEFFFRDDVFYVEKGSSDEIKTKVISDESPAEIKIEFISSDPSVLSVDGSFFKAEKVSPDPVTVTGRYTYNGVTYEDTCEFYVRIPVEGVKVNEKEINLKKGETFSQSVTFSPDDATLTKLYWFSTDENIAVVDENGVITAKENGTAYVYCITLDGNYKSSCTVEISE